MNNKGRNQIVGNTGLYYICYELSKRGWKALTTSRICRPILGLSLFVFVRGGEWLLLPKVLPFPEVLVYLRFTCLASKT